MTAALATYLALLLTWAAFDYAGFGLVMTRQRWGDPTQRRKWASLPTWQKAAYRVVQYAFILATAYLALPFSPAGTVAALAAACLFSAHDLGYHLVGGHVGHPKWQPFSMREKRKPWSLHYWPIRWHVKMKSLDRHGHYPHGVPARWETWGRIVGTATVTAALIGSLL